MGAQEEYSDCTSDLSVNIEDLALPSTNIMQPMNSQILRTFEEIKMPFNKSNGLNPQ